ncbi:alkaline phosphatase D family protein [Tenacibaculum xiamenense]|uniref:alkaline phosphatase D family protein n=1 Tax=Tenacibaculum xiamenense TaxID=1261553 RepID=UPI0038935CC4
MRSFFNLSLLLMVIQTFAQTPFQITKIERPFTTERKGMKQNNYDWSKTPFLHGVASGDPLFDRVIIWTRITQSTPDEDITVFWEIASDANFKHVVNSGYTNTNSGQDYTVKVDADQLNENTSYYYRFKVDNTYSVTGKTRTAPKSTKEVENLRFAIVSCSNYQAGYFNAYQNIANRSDIDAVIHLGDYIYEYKKGGYGYSSSRPDRGHEPKHEIVTLEDYRVRYSYYRLDPNLQDIHQQHPFITVWDDHEFANDAHKDGAENHDDSEGDWNERKRNAKKAYFEWLPVRENSEDSKRIYRKISYGKLLDLFMVDTRIEGRTKQMGLGRGTTSKEFLALANSKKDKLEWATYNMVEDSYRNNLSHNEKITMANYIAKALKIELEGKSKTMSRSKVFSDSEIKEIEFLMNKAEKNIQHKLSLRLTQNRSSRSILGDQQKTWLKNGLSQSDATWKVIGNQVMMAPFGLKINRFSNSWYSFLIPSWMKKWHQLNKDDWNFYLDEKNEMLDYIKNNSNNIAVLTGDIHMMFASQIERNGNCIVPEFTTPSVTSPNLDMLPDWVIWLLEKLTNTTADAELIEDNPHIKRAHTTAHGYYILDIRKNQIQADWYFINTKERVDPSAYFKVGFKNELNQCGLINSPKTTGEDRGSYVADNSSAKNTKTVEQFSLLGVYSDVKEKNINVHYGFNKTDKLTVQIFDIQGQLVKTVFKDRSHEEGLYNLKLFLNNLKSGFYLVRATNGLQNFGRKVFLK